METLRRGSKGPLAGVAQSILKRLNFYTATVDDDYGGVTEEAVKAFQRSRNLVPTGAIDEATWTALSNDQKKLDNPPPVIEEPQLPVPSGDTKPPWKKVAEKYKGKNEADPAFRKEIEPQGKKLFGISWGPLTSPTWAWCGLAMAIALAGSGLDYMRNGEMAANWAKYDQEIVWQKDGIPEGAVVQINHVKCGNGSNNHVSEAEGDCAPQDLIEMKKGDDGVWRATSNPPKLKAGATIDLYGGNQGNTWKVSTYSVKEICAVRWPNKPQGILDAVILARQWIPARKILTSVRCTSAKQTGDSTR